MDESQTGRFSIEVGLKLIRSIIQLKTESFIHKRDFSQGAFGVLWVGATRLEEGYSVHNMP